MTEDSDNSINDLSKADQILNESFIKVLHNDDFPFNKIDDDEASSEDYLNNDLIELIKDKDNKFSNFNQQNNFNPFNNQNSKLLNSSSSVISDFESLKLGKFSKAKESRFINFQKNTLTELCQVLDENNVVKEENKESSSDKENEKEKKIEDKSDKKEKFSSKSTFNSNILGTINTNEYNSNVIYNNNNFINNTTVPEQYPIKTFRSHIEKELSGDNCIVIDSTQTETNQFNIKTTTNKKYESNQNYGELNNIVPRVSQSTQNTKKFKNEFKFENLNKVENNFGQQQEQNPIDEFDISNAYINTLGSNTNRSNFSNATETYSTFTSNLFPNNIYKSPRINDTLPNKINIENKSQFTNYLDTQHHFPSSSLIMNNLSSFDGRKFVPTFRSYSNNTYDHFSNVNEIYNQRYLSSKSETSLPNQFKNSLNISGYSLQESNKNNNKEDDLEKKESGKKPKSILRTSIKNHSNSVFEKPGSKVKKLVFENDKYMTSKNSVNQLNSTNQNNSINYSNYGVNNQNVNTKFINKNFDAPINFQPNILNCTYLSQNTLRTTTSLNSNLVNQSTEKSIDYSLISDKELAKISYNLAKEQLGCRFLQKKMDETQDFTEKNLVPYLMPHFIELSCDPFGNYLIQKFITKLNSHTYKFIVEKVFF